MTTNATTPEDLSTLRLPELQKRFQEVVGEATRSPNRTHLIRRIMEAQTAATGASATPKNRKPKLAPKRATKTPSARRKPEEMMVLPVRLEASLVKRIDAAWERKGLKSRMDLFRQSLSGFFKKGGELELADLITATAVTDPEQQGQWGASTAPHWSVVRQLGDIAHQSYLSIKQLNSTVHPWTCLNTRLNHAGTKMSATNTLNRHVTAMMQTLRFGIEIETVGQPRAAIARAIHSVVGGNLAGDSVVDMKSRTWKVVADGSLSGSTNGEIVSPILTYSDLDELQAIVRAVRNAGCKADPSTGIHIHVDGARFDAKVVVNLVKMINKQERLIERALGISETRRQRYCKPIDQTFLRRLEAERPRTLQEVSRAWYGREGVHPSRYDSSRYHGLNLNSLFFRGTVEFRYFNGSLHAGEIKAYVQFVLALAVKALGSKATQSKKRDFKLESSKYDFRVFLLGLGLIGSEFKTARLHLMKHLGGSAAWKNGRPAPRPAQAESVPAPDAPATESES